MTLAFRTMLQYGFDKLQLRRIEVRIATENEQSKKIPERFHFVQEGILRNAEWLHDRFVDHIIYSLLEDEWQQLT